MECELEIRADLHKNLLALTDEQIGAVLRLVFRRSIKEEMGFMEEKEIDESEFFSHEDGIVALTAQLLWSDIKLSRQ
jgi:hypothetical protein